MGQKVQKIENKFGRFFYTPQYIRFKNHLFNYRLRKLIIHSAFLRFFPIGKKMNLRLADIGSGISPISPVPERTLFIELEIEAVEFLRKKGLNAIEADITNLPLKNSSLDVVFCSEVLEHVKDYKTAIKEVYRVLDGGGKFFITVPVHMKYWKDDDEYVGHYRRFNPKKLIKDLEKECFKVTYVEPIGGKIERYITYFLVKIAKSFRQEFRENKFKEALFRELNSILLSIVRISSKSNKMKNASILFIVAEKV